MARVPRRPPGQPGLVLEGVNLNGEVESQSTPREHGGHRELHHFIGIFLFTREVNGHPASGFFPIVTL